MGKSKYYIIIFMALFLSAKVGNTYGKIPNFRIGLVDSTYYSIKELGKDKPVLFFYFSPTCDDCEYSISKIINRMDQLKDIQIIMMTNESLGSVTQFYKKYGLHKYSNIKVGTEGISSRFLRNFAIEKLPFFVFYKNSDDLGKQCILKQELDEFLQACIL